MPERICKICGKTFFAKSSRRSFCYEPHYHPCPICGKDVLTKDLYHLDECCCPEHSRLLATRTIHERFEEWPSSSEEAKQRRIQTNLDRFGVDNPAKAVEIRQKISTNFKKAYAENKETINNKRKQTCLASYGYDHYSKSPEYQKKQKAKLQAKYGVSDTFKVPEFKAKADVTNLERWGTIKPMQNHEVWKKQRSKRSHYVGCDGTVLDSTYEVAVYDFCIRNNISIQRTYPISYEYNGETHKTFIDFVIDGLLVEVKGEHAMNGFYDCQPGNIPMNVKLDIYKKHHVIVITGQSEASFFNQSCGLKYPEIDPQPLIGIDIELFKNPQFPYADNRPKCFYNVKVNNSKSIYDAFNDEQLRWKMIKNRIDYMGGFISSKQIITALNVTKTCKQPSWFAKSYAEYLIRKYSDSSIIVDPFAGWGTRCDAAMSSHRTYVGCDLNRELVEWHQSKNRPIVLADAKTFTFNGECDVFTCPPYEDTEVYFEGQDTSLTECQWLDIIRRNIPNARKYIMVCRTVSPEYEKYVVEKKENKSHLGTNYESVIVVENNR